MGSRCREGSAQKLTLSPEATSSGQPLHMETWFSPVCLQRTPGLAVDGQYVLENHNVSIISECFVLKPCLLLIYCTFLSCVFMGVWSVLVLFSFFFLFSVGFVLFCFVFIGLLGCGVGGWIVGRSGRRGGRGDCDQNILCEKNLFFKKLFLTTVWLSLLLYNLPNALLLGTHRMSNLTSHILFG